MDKIKIKKSSLWLGFSILLIILLILSIFTQGFRNFNSLKENEVKQKASEFLKLTLNDKAQIIDIKEERGLYHLTVSLDGKNYNTYLTKDGSLFFPSVIELDKVDKRAINRSL